MFKKIKETIILFFNNIKQIKKDKDNRIAFVNDIKQQILDPQSKFNQLRLQCDENYNYISTIVNIPDEFQIGGSDIDKYRKLNDIIRPINKYLINDLNWGEYFVNPEFFYIDTNTETGTILEEVSCAYVASWRYSPVLNKYPNFKYQLAAFIGINVALIVAITLLILL